MPVIQLVQYRSKETAKVFQALADMALQGKIVGAALCYQTQDNEEHAAFTGAYRENPARAVNAAMRLSWQLTQMQDQKP